MMFKDTRPYRPGLETIRSPWSSAGLYPNSLFQREFGSSTRITAIANIFSEHSAVNITSRVFRRFKDRWNNSQNKEQANLLIAVPGDRTVWTRASDQSFKVYYQFPFDPLAPVLSGWQGYGSFYSTRAFKNSSFRLGAVRAWQQGWLDLRTRFNIGQFKPETYLSCKAVYRGDKLQAGIVLAGSLQNRMLQKNDLEVGVRIVQDHWVWGSLYCQKFRTYQINYSRLGSYFDWMKLAYVAKHKDLTVGLELDYSVEDNESKSIEAVVEYQPKWDRLKWAKVKLNTQWQLSMAGEVCLGDNFKLKGSLYWFNMFKQARPSQFSLRITYN